MEALLRNDASKTLQERVQESLGNLRKLLRPK